MGCKEFKDFCASDFRHRIVIETPTKVSDGQGGYTFTWATFKSVWASVNPVKAQQVFFAGQLQHQVSHKIKTRYVSGLLAVMRINFDGRIFKIRQIRDIAERKQYHEVMAWENKQS